MVQVDLVLQTLEIKGLQGKSHSGFRAEGWAQLRQRPAVRGEVANLDESILVLEGDDGRVGAAGTLVVQGCYTGVGHRGVSLTG